MKKILCALLLIASTPVLAFEDIAAVAACMRANLPDSLQLQQIALDSYRRDGSHRNLRGRLYFKREKEPAPGMLQVMLRIDSPPAFEGASYLIRESAATPNEGMYVYLPAVKRVRRVVGQFGDNALFDTDFSYREFQLVMGVMHESTLSLEDEEQVEGRAAMVLMVTPDDPSSARYTRMRFWIDKDSCRPLRGEFFEGKVLRKRFSASVESLRESADGKRYLSLGRMEDLVEGSRTELRVLRQELNVPMPPKLFDPAGFYLLR